MGFLDDKSISGTTDIDLGRGYWVRVRNCLDHEHMETAQGVMSRNVVLNGDLDAQGNAAVRTVDPAPFRTYMVAASIVDWNLDDGHGDSAVVWPHGSLEEAMAGVKRLPEAYFQQIWTVVDELNSRRPAAEQARFPAAADAGDPQRQAGPDGADEVRAGAASLAGARAEPFGVLPAPLA
jgi:hypothetical protein